MRWSRALRPLADAFVARYLEFLPRARYPLRYGVHSNTAFALAFALGLAALGLGAVGVLERDTCAEEEHFFSYRRATLRQEPDYGRELSAIVIEA